MRRNVRFVTNLQYVGAITYHRHRQKIDFVQPFWNKNTDNDEMLRPGVQLRYLLFLDVAAHRVATAFTGG
jgi:hypothetical protein